MSFKNRSQFIKAQTSEKITLVHINAKRRIHVSTGHVTNVYSKVVPRFVEGLKQDGVELTKVYDVESIVIGSFHYDIETSTLSARFLSDANPSTNEYNHQSYTLCDSMLYKLPPVYRASRKFGYDNRSSDHNTRTTDLPSPPL